MRADRFFSEKQKFNIWFFIIPLIALNGFLLVGMILQLFYDKPMGNNPMGDVELVIFTIVIGLITAMLLNIKLETYIDKEGIKVRLFPFHIKWKQFTWSEISNAEVRKYKPLAEYGGWGLKGLGKNRAYNVSGDMGLQLKFNNGKRLLIGTGKPKDLEVVLNSILKSKNQSGDDDLSIHHY
jgi:hypothetical protein